MPPIEINTLEEARAEIIRLQEKLTETETERDSYSDKVKELEPELENVRKLNQQYFNKLSAQYSHSTEPEDDEDDVPTCEEFAKTLTI